MNILAWLNRDREAVCMGAVWARCCIVGFSYSLNRNVSLCFVMLVDLK